MLILLDIPDGHKAGECNKCIFSARGCSVKLLHNCPLQDAVKLVELNSWDEICKSLHVYGTTEE